MTIRAQHLSRIGQIHLQEAVLDVLLEAYGESDGLKPDEISKRAGIERRSIHGGNQNHIVAGLLAALEGKGLVRSIQKHAAVYRIWRLTRNEYEKRMTATSSS